MGRQDQEPRGCDPLDRSLGNNGADVQNGLPQPPIEGIDDDLDTVEVMSVLFVLALGAEEAMRQGSLSSEDTRKAQAVLDKVYDMYDKWGKGIRVSPDDYLALVRALAAIK